MTTSVDIQGMVLAQQDFQQALDQMNSIFGAMSEERDTLTANWSGIAASAFGQALEAWLEDLYQIRQELVVMTESLSAHTGVYSDANEASQQVVTAFQQGLTGLETLPGDSSEHMFRRLARMRSDRVFMRALRPEERLAAREESVQGQPLLRAERVAEAPVLPLLPARIEASELGLPLLDRREAVLPDRIEASELERPLLDRREAVLPLQPEMTARHLMARVLEPGVPLESGVRVEGRLIEPQQPVQDS